MLTSWKGALAGAAMACSVATQAQTESLVYFGTYTGGKSQGIYVSRFDPETGRLSEAELAAEARNPSFLAVHPSKSRLYAVGEVNETNGRPGGAVMAYEVDRATGRLTLLNQESSEGAGPCHISLDRTGRWALVANYGAGSVAVLPIGEDGRLGKAVCVIQHNGSSVNPQRQREPHAHSIQADPSNRVILAADLGMDQVLGYAFDETSGKLTPAGVPHLALPPGSGPRHFAFHPEGKHVFVINEMLSTIAVARYEAGRGAGEILSVVSTLPEEHQGESTTAEILAHPSGRFVYGSNRGHDSIAVFRFDAAKGALDRVELESTQGKTPRNFGIHPSGKWLVAANQDSNSVVVFRIDEATGALSPAGQTIEVGRPVCVRFL